MAHPLEPAPGVLRERGRALRGLGAEEDRPHRDRPALRERGPGRELSLGGGARASHDRGAIEARPDRRAGGVDASRGRACTRRSRSRASSRNRSRTRSSARLAEFISSLEPVIARRTCGHRSIAASAPSAISRLDDNAGRELCSRRHAPSHLCSPDISPVSPAALIESPARYENHQRTINPDPERSRAFRFERLQATVICVTRQIRSTRRKREYDQTIKEVPGGVRPARSR